MSRFGLASAVLGRPTDFAEQTAVLAAGAAAGGSFQRGLMPRSTSDQALLTGLLVATNYGLVVTSQSTIEALASALAGSDASATRFRRTALAVEVGLAAAGLGLQRLVPARPNEPMVRAGIRAVGFRATMGAVVGAAGITVTDLAAAVTRRPLRSLPLAPLGLAGAGVATATYAVLRRGLREQGELDELGMLVENDDRQLAGRAVAAGAGVAAATFAVAYGE